MNVLFWPWLAGVIGTLRFFTKLNLNWIHADIIKDHRNYGSSDKMGVVARSFSAFLGLLMACVWPALLVLYTFYKAATLGQKSKVEVEHEKQAEETKRWQEKIELERLAKKHSLPMANEDKLGPDFLTGTNMFDRDVAQLKRSYRNKWDGPTRKGEW